MTCKILGNNPKNSLLIYSNNKKVIRRVINRVFSGYKIFIIYQKPNFF